MNESMVSLGLAILAGIVWAIRKEAHLNYLEKRQDAIDKEIHEVKQKTETIGDRLVEEITKIREYLARLDERLSKD